MQGHMLYSITPWVPHNTASETEITKQEVLEKVLWGTPCRKEMKTAGLDEGEFGP